MSRVNPTFTFRPRPEGKISMTGNNQGGYTVTSGERLITIPTTNIDPPDQFQNSPQVQPDIDNQTLPLRRHIASTYHEPIQAPPKPSMVQPDPLSLDELLGENIPWDGEFPEEIPTQSLTVTVELLNQIIDERIQADKEQDLRFKKRKRKFKRSKIRNNILSFFGRKHKNHL